MPSNNGDGSTRSHPPLGPQVNTSQVLDLRTYPSATTGTAGGGAIANTQTFHPSLIEDDRWGYHRFLGDQYDEDRNLYTALGYTTDLRTGHYVGKFERGPGIARAIVDKPVRDAWSGEITVEEAGETDVDETDFERECRKFLNGDYTRLPPAARFRAAHRWARLLEFSLVLIGVDDGNVERGDVDTLAQPVDADALDSMADLQYLAVYDQRRVDWEETTLVDDPTDPRYRLPKTYHVEIADDESADIHWTRILHDVEFPGEDELKSTPIYKPIFNRLEDLQKLIGGSAEMFWRSAYPGLVLTPPTDEQGVPMVFDDDGDEIATQIKNYRHNLDRLLKVNGGLEKLDTNVAPPKEHFDVQVQDISAYLDMPMSIIRGNETGERATQEDLSMYYDFVGRLRDSHNDAQVLRPILTRFLDWGMLPTPASADDVVDDADAAAPIGTAGGIGASFDIIFEALEETTEQEEAETALTWAQAFKAATAGSPRQAFTFPEIRMKGFGMDPEIGSEAPDAVDPEELAADSVVVPPEEDTAESMPGETPTLPAAAGTGAGDGDDDDGEAAE